MKPEQQSLHSMYNCKGCSNNELYRLHLSRFPTKSKAGKKKAAVSGLTSKENPVLIDTTKSILKDMNQQYRNVFRTSFLAAQKVVIAENSLTSDEITMSQPISSTPLILDQFTVLFRAYGVTLSLSCRQKLRMTSSFETKEQAKQRTENKIKKGVKRKLDHVGKYDSYTCDFEDCCNEVNNYSDDHIINYSDLARKFNLKNSFGNLPKNGGQILKEMLNSQGLDLSRLSCVKKRERSVIRRKKRR